MTTFYIEKRRSASIASLPPRSPLSRHGARYRRLANMGCCAQNLVTQAQRGAWSRIGRTGNLASTARIGRRSRAFPNGRTAFDPPRFSSGFDYHRLPSLSLPAKVVVAGLHAHPFVKLDGSMRRANIAYRNDHPNLSGRFLKSWPSIVPNAFTLVAESHIRTNANPRLSLVK